MSLSKVNKDKSRGTLKYLGLLSGDGIDVIKLMRGRISLGSSVSFLKSGEEMVLLGAGVFWQAIV